MGVCDALWEFVMPYGSLRGLMGVCEALWEFVMPYVTL